MARFLESPLSVSCASHDFSQKNAGACARARTWKIFFRRFTKSRGYESVYRAIVA